MMKTRILTICMMAMGIAFMPQTAEAQGLLKKIGKGIEKVNKTLDKANGTAEASAEKTIAEVPIEGGGTISNSLSNDVDIQLVGVYGKSTSENYGYIYCVFKVKMLLNRDVFQMGVAKMVDENGNTYKPTYDNIKKDYDVTEGVYVKIANNEQGWYFKDVKKSTKNLQNVSFGIAVKRDSWVQGTLTFKDVPVQWDVE